MKFHKSLRKNQYIITVSAQAIILSIQPYGISYGIKGLGMALVMLRMIWGIAFCEIVMSVKWSLDITLRVCY